MPVLNVFDLFKNSAFVKLKSKWTKRYKLLTLLLFWLIQVISVQSVVFYFYTNIMALRTRQGCSIQWRSYGGAPGDTCPRAQLLKGRKNHKRVKIINAGFWESRISISLICSPLWFFSRSFICAPVEWRRPCFELSVPWCILWSLLRAPHDEWARPACDCLFIALRLNFY